MSEEKTKIFDVAQGIRFAAFMFFVNAVLLGGGSYFTGCAFGDVADCTVANGVYWVRSHPGFAPMIPIFTVLGFVVGAVGGVVGRAIAVVWPKSLAVKDEHIQGAIAWIVVILLIAAFALWGLPDLLDLRKSMP